VVFENLGPPLSNVMYIIHIPCTVQEIQTHEIESIVLNHAVQVLHKTEHINFVFNLSKHSSYTIFHIL